MVETDEWSEPVQGTPVNRWKPTEIGQSIVGEVVDIQKGKFGEEATLKQDDGVEITTPGHAYLIPLIKSIEIGQRIKVKVTGAKKGGKGTGFTYEIRTSKQQQKKVTDQPVDAAGKFLKMLKSAPAGLMDKVFYDEVQKATGGTIYECSEFVEKLKTQGLIYKLGETWKAT